MLDIENTEAEAAGPVKSFNEAQSPSWINGPLPDNLESKLFPPGAEKPQRVWTEAGYKKFQINPFSPDTYQIVGYQREIEHLAKGGNTEAIRGYMDNPVIRNFFAQEFKIHLQPDRRFTPLVATHFTKLLQNPDIRKLVKMFKISTKPAGADGNGHKMPEIVIYPTLGRENVYKLVTILRTALAKDDEYGTGTTPRYNIDLNNLIFLAQSGGDLKNALAQAGLLDHYFDRSTEYAFMIGEKDYWKDQTSESVLNPQSKPASSEVSPRTALDRARVMLKVALARKNGSPLKWDEPTREATLIVQSRLDRGENIEQIIAKSAANVRGLISKKT